MSFQAYLDTIKAKTGKTPADFKQLASKKGLLKPTIKASEIVSWLKEDFNLGHGHAMAIYACFKDHPNAVAAIKKQSTVEFPVKLAQPALRALAAAKINNLKQLSKLSLHELSALHGIGKNAIDLLSSAMAAEGLSFKRKNK